ncbi:DUF481 domain-containing protein [Candidatus Margulisiibacteriota bacterium]
MRIFLSIFLLLFLLSSARAETTIERKFSLGGQLAGGNSDVESIHLEFYLDRSRSAMDKTVIRGSFDREFSQGLETQYKANTTMRYSRFLSPHLFNYYKLDLYHDKMQDISARFIPTAGIGYWFLKDVSLSSMLEIAVGYQKDYLVNQTADDLFVMNVGSDIVWGVFSNNLDIYAALNDLDNYRLVNIARLTFKLNKYYAFKLTLKEEYNNRPPAGILNNDLSLITSLEFATKEIL